MESETFDCLLRLDFLFSGLVYYHERQNRYWRSILTRSKLVEMTWGMPSVAVFWLWFRGSRLLITRGSRFQISIALFLESYVIDKNNVISKQITVLLCAFPVRLLQQPCIELWNSLWNWSCLLTLLWTWDGQGSKNVSSQVSFAYCSCR